MIPECDVCGHQYSQAGSRRRFYLAIDQYGDQVEAYSMCSARCLRRAVDVVLDETTAQRAKRVDLDAEWEYVTTRLDFGAAR